MRIKPGLILCFIIAVAIIINILQIAEGQHWSDFALYVMQAESIVTQQMDELYQMNKYNVENSSSPIGPSVYPWGFPLLLAPLYYIFGLNLYAFKLLIVFFFGASLYAMFILFKNKLREKSTLLLVSIFAFNPLFIYYNNSILSDIPYLFFSLITLYFIQQFIIEERKFYNNFISYLLIGFFIFICYFIRSNGIIFIPVLLLCQFYKKYEKKKDFSAFFRLSYWHILSLIPYILFILLKLCTVYILPNGSSSHLDLLSMVSVSSILDNIYYYLKLPQHFYFLNILKIFYYITVPFVIYGVYKNFKRDYLYLIYVSFSLIILIIWPFQEGIRFVFPFLPFYFYFTFLGFEQFQQDFLNSYTTSKIKLIPGFAFVVIAIFVTLQTKKLIEREKIFLNGPYTVDSQDMFQFINNNLQGEDTIVFRKPRTMMLFTKQLSFREERLEKLKNLNNHYFVYDDLEKENEVDMDKISSEQAIYFKLIYTNNRFAIYKIQNEAALMNASLK